MRLTKARKLAGVFIALVLLICTLGGRGLVVARAEDRPDATPHTSEPPSTDPVSQGAEESGVKQATIPLPPMGWGSWNSFANSVDAEIVMRQAKAIVSSGMKAAGYQYMLIDEGWWLGGRDKNGNIVVDPKQWPALEPGEQPGDMSNIVKYLHGLGLKAATYTDAGRNGCSTTIGPGAGPNSLWCKSGFERKKGLRNPQAGFVECTHGDGKA